MALGGGLESFGPGFLGFPSLVRDDSDSSASSSHSRVTTTTFPSSLDLPEITEEIELPAFPQESVSPALPGYVQHEFLRSHSLPQVEAYVPKAMSVSFVREESISSVPPHVHMHVLPRAPFLTRSNTMKTCFICQNELKHGHGFGQYHGMEKCDCPDKTVCEHKMVCKSHGNHFRLTIEKYIKNEALEDEASKADHAFCETKSQNKCRRCGYERVKRCELGGMTREAVYKAIKKSLLRNANRSEKAEGEGEGEGEEGSD